MYIDVSFPRPSSSPRLGILVYWLPIDSVLLTEPLQLLYLDLILYIIEEKPQEILAPLLTPSFS